MSNVECKTITKKELVNRIAESTGQTKVVVKERPSGMPSIHELAPSGQFAFSVSLEAHLTNPSVTRKMSASLAL